MVAEASEQHDKNGELEVFDSINELIEAANSDLMESSSENEYWTDDSIRPGPRPANQSPI